MFHPDYKHITDKLPASLVKRTYQRLLHHSKDPVPLESISEKSERIEDYLCYTLKVYQNSLNWKRKTMNCKNPVQPEVSCPLTMHKLTDLSQRGTLPEPKAKELKQQLLEYNRDTFGQFMQDLNKTHEKQLEANHQMHLEIKNLKLRVQKVEKFLTYLKSLTNLTSGTYSNSI